MQPCVHKFGGSSLADAACHVRVVELLRASGEPAQVIVVSAMHGVTNALVSLGPDMPASARDALIDTLRARHLAVAESLQQPALTQWLTEQFAKLAETVRRADDGTWPAALLAEVHGLGELCNTHLLAARLRQQGLECAVLDAREVLTVQHGELGASVDWPVSQAAWDAWRKRNPAERVLVTGFVARDAEGQATTLGRNGSDYSAAIFATLADAKELTLWGDTDGVLSADPHLVPEAVPLTSLSYHEACEMAYFGAKIIHPRTMIPAMRSGLNIRIRNTFRPELPGTRIAAAGPTGRPVKGLTTISGMAMLNIEGAGMLGVPGTAERVFGALRAAGVSVSMISQGSSEHSICCVIRDADAERAQAALDAEFAAEIAAGAVQGVTVAHDISILAAVGDGMVGMLGVAARLFEGVARARVNIRAIAQGASERSITLAVSSADAARALRAAHSAFLLSGETISIGLIGPGHIGSALLEQLRTAQERLRADAGLDLRIRAIANSRRQWLDEGKALPADWRQQLEHSKPTDPDAFVAQVLVSHLPHAVIIDCTASEAVADRYADWLKAGIHVITPSKRAISGPIERWQRIRAASAIGAAQLRYEATVGAGLPIIQTLRDLIDTGDELTSVEGILSGTLAWLFNHYDGKRPFSELLREAHALGYTEPDPRDDLAGVDVARKLVILAREAGGMLDLKDVVVESLVPPALMTVDREEFLRRLPELDAAMAARHAKARAANRHMRYMARLDQRGAAWVGLGEVADEHAFARLRSTDNIVQFSTRRYCDTPLVVQGPGAGPEVTAACVFADLLRVAAVLRRGP
jgi:aspartokinase/homoserine dehydrogenase 1